MAATRRELAEDVLKKVNGGFYFDTENMLLGISKDGPLYKFADSELGEVFREVYLSACEAVGEPDEVGRRSLDEALEAMIANGALIPYQS